MSVALNKANVALDNIQNNEDDSWLDDEVDSLGDPIERPQVQQLNEEPGQIEQAPAMPLDDPIEKAKLIKQILNYKQSILGKYLTCYDLSEQSLPMRSNEELNNLLSQIRFSVGVKTNANFWYLGFNKAMVATEVITTSVGIKTTGLANILNGSEECKEIITEIMLKRGSMSYIEPEYRLAFLVGSTIMTLHQHNSSMEAVKDFTKDEIKKEIEDKYKDL